MNCPLLRAWSSFLIIYLPSVEICFDSNKTYACFEICWLTPGWNVRWVMKPIKSALYVTHTSGSLSFSCELKYLIKTNDAFRHFYIRYILYFHLQSFEICDVLTPNDVRESPKVFRKEFSTYENICKIYNF